MTAVNKVLVVGGGVAGAAVATFLAKGGVSVRLIEAKPDLHALGSGITIQGNALRILRDLGVWDQVRDLGYSFDELGLRAPDPAGTVIAVMPDVRSGGPDLPATVGMYRPDLAQIMIDNAIASGVTVDYGLSPASLTQSDAGVTVALSDGSTDTYDLVVGADGIRSHVRKAMGITSEPRGTGMGIWRVFAHRPDSVTRTDLFYGGPSYIAGYCPTGEDSLYAYIVEDYSSEHARLAPADMLAVMRQKSEAYHGPWDDLRPHLTEPDRINYTKFETHVVEAPWHRGRIVLVGDAAHTCPPTLAQGAAMALEDAAVLTELLLGADAVDDDLLDAYSARRIPRAQMVVDASVQLGQWLLDHERGDVPGLMGSVFSTLVNRP